MSTLSTSSPRLAAPLITLDDDPTPFTRRDVLAIDAEASPPAAVHVDATCSGHIVVAVVPGQSTDVVDTAFDLAAERGLPVLAVRAWHDPDVPLGGWLRPHGTVMWDALRHKARIELDRAVEQANVTHPAVQVGTVVVNDDLVPFLVALSTRAVLLVLGRPRRSDQASPVDALVRQAACPVLVVPPTRRPDSEPACAPDTSAD